MNINLMKPVWRKVTIANVILPIAIFAFAVAANAAEVYWVGGQSALWGAANWSTANGGEGAAWTDGDTGWFTTSPAAIDLNGVSPGVGRFRSNGFSADNRCAINISNSSSTPSTLTFSGLNRSTVDGVSYDLLFTDLSFENVSVKDISTWGFELTNGSHVRFGKGATYGKPNKNSSGEVYVGMYSATSNTLTVVDGATFTVATSLHVGNSGRNGSMAACTGVVYVAGATLKVNSNIYMARDTDSHTSGSAGTGTLIVEDGGRVESTGEFQFGSSYKQNQSYIARGDLYVRKGGIMKCSKFVMREYNNCKVVVDGGTLDVVGNFEGQYGTSGSKVYYKCGRCAVEVKNGGTIAANTFYVNNYHTSSQPVTFDGGTLKAKRNFNSISSNSGDGDYADFNVGEGGMTIDTQEYTVTWQTRIDGGAGKLVKKGSGILNYEWTPYNEGGFDIMEGTLCFGGDNTKLAYGTLTVFSGATLTKTAKNKADKLASALVLKNDAKIKALTDTSATPIGGESVTIEGTVEVSFDAALQPKTDYPILRITSNGTFSESDLTKIRLNTATTAGGMAVARLSADGKTISCRLYKGFKIILR